MRSSQHRATTLNPKITRNEQDSRFDRTSSRVTEPSQFFRNTLNRIGASGQNYQLFGCDNTSGRAYFFKSGTGGNGFVQSDDNAATFSANRTLPAGITSGSVASAVEFGGNVYIEATDGTSYGVWSTPIVAQGSDFGTWSSKLVSLPGGSSAFSFISLRKSSWGNGNDALFLVTYGDPKITGVNAAGIWRSTDGTTWTQVYGPDSTIRHIHALEADPYVANHVVMTCGDGIATSIQHSTDGGVTWSVLIGSANWQATQISFTATDYWFARDSLRSGPVVVDRDTLTPRQGAQNWHHFIPPPMCAGVGYRQITDGVITAGDSRVASATAKFVKSDFGRYVESHAYIPPGSFVAAAGQQIAITGQPTGGTWTYGTVTGIAWNVSAATLQAALISAYGAGIVVTTSGSLASTMLYWVAIPSSLGDFAQLPTTSALTGGTTPTTTSRTTATLNNTAINSASGTLGIQSTISGNMYFANCLAGVVDPATGIWYQAANDSSNAGQVAGIFYMRQKGGRVEILDPGGVGYPIIAAMAIFGGYLYCGNFRYKLLTLAST